MSDLPLARGDSKVLQETAWNDAVEYYLKAQQLDASFGMIYNQLGAMLERKDAATNNVCLGACMHFAIAATARNPARSGRANFRRAIGMHRNALNEHMKDHNLELPKMLQNQYDTRISVCVTAYVMSELVSGHECCSGAAQVHWVICICDFHVAAGVW